MLFSHLCVNIIIIAMTYVYHNNESKATLSHTVALWTQHSVTSVSDSVATRLLIFTCRIFICAAPGSLSLLRSHAALFFIYSYLRKVECMLANSEGTNFERNHTTKTMIGITFLS